MWIDKNRNGAQDADEPGLPRTPVRLERSSVSQASVRAVRPAAVSASAAYLETITDADGRYVFAEVEPGSWSVRATLTASSLSQVFDSSGAVDWVVPVSVPAGGEARGDFAAAGSARLVGTIETTTGARINEGTATVVWGGPDGVIGNDDDVTFEVPFKNGTFSISGIPAGPYRVSGVAADGRASSLAGVTVDEGTARATVVVPERLPQTGSKSRAIMMLGVLLMLVGIALKRVPSRRSDAA